MRTPRTITPALGVDQGQNGRWGIGFLLLVRGTMAGIFLLVQRWYNIQLYTDWWGSIQQSRHRSPGVLEQASKSLTVSTHNHLQKARNHTPWGLHQFLRPTNLSTADVGFPFVSWLTSKSLFVILAVVTLGFHDIFIVLPLPSARPDIRPVIPKSLLDEVSIRRWLQPATPRHRLRVYIRS